MHHISPLFWAQSFPTDHNSVRCAIARQTCLVISTLLLCSLTAQADPNSAQQASPAIDFNADVRPILSDRCFLCHGPDEQGRQAELRLDDPSAATQPALSDVVPIVPGDAAASEVYRRITSEDADLRMPPPDSGKSLSPQEIEILQKWIDAGATYQQHWAFTRIERPDLPQVPHDWNPQNPIDHFVFAKLKNAGRSPAPQASPEEILRRIQFDIVGLPPTPAEIDSFLESPLPEAVASRIGELFNSPHYGERMAIDWLDIARFADSNGYQNDFARSMWPWRNWVIDAYNQNKPLDEFLIEQLAGDLLPDATLTQKIATGFCRNHRMVTEAGSIEEEWRVENVIDRVETMSAAFLGLTTGCARCHDHKFDPLTQREFYQLFAFFNSIDEKGVYTETRGNVPPLLFIPPPEHATELNELAPKIDTATQKVEALTKTAADQTDAWYSQLIATKTQDNNRATATAPLTELLDVTRADGTRQSPLPDSKLPQASPTLLGQAAKFTGKESVDFASPTVDDASLIPNFSKDDPFSVSIWVRCTGNGAIFTKMNDKNDYRGVDLMVFGDLKFGMHFIHKWPTDAMKVVTDQPLPRDRWCHVVATYDGSGQADGIRIYVDAHRQQLKTEVDQLKGEIVNDEPLRVGRRQSDNEFRGQLQQLSFFDRSLNEEEIAGNLESSLAVALRSDLATPLSDAESDELSQIFLAYGPDSLTGGLHSARTQLQQLQSRKRELEKDSPSVMVLAERDEPRQAYVLKRGLYDAPDKDQPVSPNIPDFLPPLSDDLPRNRLGLAKWLVSRENPLTARVIVNRLWQRCFGLGLVKTSEDFGMQSQLPSHPKLLDWLAIELIESGWDYQHVQRLIFQSATYQQSSQVAAELYQQDPDNRLLARGPRRRLPAELIRDNALAISGLITLQVGGPSVMPYQPEGLWEELAGGAREEYTQVQGEDLYRRSLYVYRKRTVPHPSMSTFDAPSWEICQVKRATTNTPLQALALLNDVVYVEAARKFAERILTEGGSNDADRFVFAYRAATGRKPITDELVAISRALAHFRDHFNTYPERAHEFLQHGESPIELEIPVPELAAYAATASLILNLDETISKP